MPAKWNEVIDRDAPLGGGRSFNREVVAVRWQCTSCWATTVGAPDALPSGWVELPPSPWNINAGPSYACPEHAEKQARRSAGQWSRYEGRTYEVSAAEIQRLKAMLKALTHRVDQLRFTGNLIDTPR